MNTLLIYVNNTRLPRVARFAYTVIGLLLLLRPVALLGADRRALSGRVPMSVATTALTPVGRAPSSDKMSLSIGLAPRHSDQLEQFLNDLYDPAHAQFRHYLTPYEYTERYGPTREDYEAVIGFAQAHRLEITGIHPNRLLLDVRGAVSDIEEAFGVRLFVYQRAGGGLFHAPDVEPSVEATLPIETVSGLSSAHLPQPMLHLGAAGGIGGFGARGGTGPAGSFMAADLRTAYLPGVTQTGAGQSVALVEFDGFYTNDISVYESRNGLPAVPLQTVWLGGFDGTPGANNPEVALDAELAIAMAPGLDRVIFYATSSYSATAVNSLFNRIATDNAARQISCSWWFETDSTTERIFQQLAAQGQSLLVASGDFGAWPSAFLSVVDGVASGLPQPQESPNVTLVGGTSLSLTGAGGAWIGERVWNMGFFYPQYWASSGGVSPSVALPTWQIGMANLANGASTKKRNMPDVAMVAENIWIAFNNGQTGPGGGTSCSAPLWAGYIALANELAQSAGKPPLGFLNPALYRLGSGPTYTMLFHDITEGNNATSFNRTNFPAVPGYDLCTGWGTPQGSNLLYALALPDSLVISPGPDATVSGPVGGPFSPRAPLFALTNSGSTTLHWMLGGLPNWLDASETSGILTPGDPATEVNLNFNEAAAQLYAGTYQAVLLFTNTDNGVVQNRSVTLEVAAKPAITINPATLTVIAGSAATFTATASGNPPMSFQWRHAGTNLDGAIGPVLTLAKTSEADAGAYSVIVTNGFGSVVSAVVPLVVAPATTQGVLLETIYSFTGGIDGASPMEMAIGQDGNLYGTTYSGGKNKYGTIFRIASDGTFASLYSFPTGGLPLDGLTPVGSSNFFGVSFAGGSSSQGSLFSVTMNRAVRILYNFPGDSSGGNPAAAPTRAVDGNYYGVTTVGGDPTLRAGVIYRITAAGQYTVVHALAAGEGARPNARLTAGRDGYLYGTTTAGGDSPNDGTIFRVSTNGIFTTLVHWHGTNGFSPAGPLVEGDDGNLYGLADGGATGFGVAYRMSPSGAVTILHSFEGLDDGSLSGLREGKLTRASDGNFYGMVGGSAGSGALGTIFRLTPTGQITTIASFNGVSGANPTGSLVEGPDGYLYGSTSNGGAFGYGAIFRIGVFPHIEVGVSPSGLTSSWPAWASNFTLQQSPDAGGGTWADVTIPPSLTPDGLRFFVTLPSTAGDTFYRLKQQ